LLASTDTAIGGLSEMPRRRVVPGNSAADQRLCLTRSLVYTIDVSAGPASTTPSVPAFNSL
jgi:hypothetical protein